MLAAIMEYVCPTGYANAIRSMKDQIVDSKSVNWTVQTMVFVTGVMECASASICSSETRVKTKNAKTTVQEMEYVRTERVCAMQALLGMTVARRTVSTTVVEEDSVTLENAIADLVSKEKIATQRVCRMTTLTARFHV